MKRFLMFAGSTYYPGGGMEDYIGDAETIEKALRILVNKSSDFDWWHIADRDTMKIVDKGNNGLYK